MLAKTSIEKHWQALRRICAFCLKSVPLSEKNSMFCKGEHRKDYYYLKKKDIREKRKLKTSP